jgi:hypothetical protein
MRISLTHDEYALIREIGGRHIPVHKELEADRIVMNIAAKTAGTIRARCEAALARHGFDDDLELNVTGRRLESLLEKLLPEEG